MQTAAQKKAQDKYRADKAVILSTQLPKEMGEAFKAKVKESGLSVNGALRMLVEEYLNSK